MEESEARYCERNQTAQGSGGALSIHLADGTEVRRKNHKPFSGRITKRLCRHIQSLLVAPFNVFLHERHFQDPPDNEEPEGAQGTHREPELSRTVRHRLLQHRRGKDQRQTEQTRSLMGEDKVFHLAGTEIVRGEDYPSCGGKLNRKHSSIGKNSLEKLNTWARHRRKPSI